MYIDELMSVGFSQAKFLEPLDDVMTPEVAANYAEDVVKNISSFNGKIYTVPGDTQPMFFFVNKDMFKEAGVKIPTTEAEFMAAAKAFTKDGNFVTELLGPTEASCYTTRYAGCTHHGGDYLDWKLPVRGRGFRRCTTLSIRTRWPLPRPSPIRMTL
jgi:maltose-binding protein MalE